MKEHTASVLIPAPVCMTPVPGKLPLKNLTTAVVAPEFAAMAGELKTLFSALRLPLDTVPAKGMISLRKQPMPAGAWQMQITPEGITAEAGDINGANYAVGALAQMLFAASAKGQDDALDCAEIKDAPRYPWRGFMLDSSRHFQDKEFIKKFLRILAAFRINQFHWHLVDSQGWRYPSKQAAKLGPDGDWSVGQYTLDDLREINDFARSLGICVVPEVDVPGHSRFILAHYPEYACTPEKPGSEFCIGKSESMDFIKKILAELLEIFPDTPYIHLGGDEASTTHWEQCPVCQAALKEKNLKNMRELENAFMVELTRFIVEKGRTPILWGPASAQEYPQDTILQAWLNMRDPLTFLPQGNKVIYSVHHSLYFDYPANLSEHWETWMLELSEQGVYMTDPDVLWPEKVKDTIIGTEACMWTETIPQHRILAKLFPRIFAYAECAWSAVANKSWHDYQRRRDILDAAGYFDYIKAQ